MCRKSELSREEHVQTVHVKLDSVDCLLSAPTKSKEESRCFTIEDKKRKCESLMGMFPFFTWFLREKVEDKKGKLGGISCRKSGAR